MKWPYNTMAKFSLATRRELASLLMQSDALFIYPATALWYIRIPRVNSQQGLTDFVGVRSILVSQARTINILYLMIMDQAFDDNLEGALSLNSTVSGWHCILAKHVIYSDWNCSVPISLSGVPSTNNGHISVFHISFREFIVNLAWLEHGVDPSKVNEYSPLSVRNTWTHIFGVTLTNFRRHPILPLPH